MTLKAEAMVTGYSTAKRKVMHFRTNEKRLLCELEDYQLRITVE